MRTTILLAAALFLTAGPALAQSPERFAGAKKLLAGIHEEIGHLETLYCGCPYVRKGRSGRDIDREACDLRARKNEKRSDHVEWEHVVPASWIGAHRACWKEGTRFASRRTAVPSRAGSAASSAASIQGSSRRTTIRTTCSQRGRRGQRRSVESPVRDCRRRAPQVWFVRLRGRWESEGCRARRRCSW